MKGVSRERPPLPKYVHIWDVEKVLNFINNFPKHEDLSLKDLTFKTITLLGLTSPKRGTELTMMDTSFMGKSESTYLFHLPHLLKHSKQGKKNPPIEFRHFLLNKNLCPVETSYLTRTKDLRENSETTKVSISYAKPHKAVGG